MKEEPIAQLAPTDRMQMRCLHSHQRISFHRSFAYQVRMANWKNCRAKFSVSMQTNVTIKQLNANRTHLISSSIVARDSGDPAGLICMIRSPFLVCF